jgi:hypothetical protein
MTTIVFAEEIKKQCAFLEDDGYVFHHAANRIWYTKTDFVISFNYSAYDYIDVYALKATKRFNEVESALQLKDSHTIFILFNGADFPDRLTTSDNYHFEISDAAGVTAYASLIADFYKEKVQPFFAAFATIMAVNEWMASRPPAEYKELISPGENLMVLRRILIMYHGGNKEYADLLGKYKASLETKKDDSSSNKIYQYLIEMEKTLK